MPIKFPKGMNIFLENQNIISSLYGSPCSIYYEGGAIVGVAIDFHVPSRSKISYLFFVEEFIFIYFHRVVSGKICSLKHLRVRFP